MGRSTRDYGADVTTRQAIGLCIALCLGTVVEWYDFTVYSQLSATLTAVFFPKSDPATAELSFWGVYAVGFIARPLGALLFGHIGDSLGRRVTLLISILAITLPTTIIGALPTYAQAGITAPVLLAILRFVQGVAVGGEFGSAIVYLYEMAPKHRRGLLASLAQLAVSPGMILGIAACLAVLYACSPEQLLVWGWRLPFLVTLFTAPLALVLRMHMPEPHEYLHSKQEMVLQRVASTAAAKVAKSFTQQHSRSSSATGRLNSQQVSQHLLSITSIKSNIRGCSIDADVGRGGAACGDSHTVKGVRPVLVALNRQDIQNAFRQKDPAAAAGVDHRNIGQSSSASPLEGLLSSSLSTTWKDLKARELAVQSESQLHYKPSNGLNDLGCEAEFAAECEELSHKIKRHRPVAVLLKEYWKGLALQFLLEGVYGALFYVFFSWVPSYLHSSTGVSTELTLWALMIGLGLFAITVPVTGHFTDLGIPKVWVYMGLTLVGAAVCIPVMYALHSGSLAALLVLVPLMIGLCGCMGGLMTSIGPQIYPAGVRATGYNLGHNLAMSIWGGLTPFIVSALALGMQPAALAAGVLIVVIAVVSWISAIPLIRIAPQTNASEGWSCCGLLNPETELTGSPTVSKSGTSV